MRTGMHPLTRRRFLAWTGVVAAGAVATGVGLDAVLSADPDPSGDPVLVLVTLYGGNDGLNTVIPASDSRYQDGRPELAYRAEDVLDLGDGLGLNPGMPRLHGLWRGGRLGIIRGVGYPKPDHSHFRSMAIWQTSSPDTSVSTGWLGRWLDATGDNPLRALSLESTLPPFLAGSNVAGSTIRPTRLPVPASTSSQAHRMLGRGDTTDSPFAAQVATSITNMFEVAATVNRALTTPLTGTGQLAAQLGAVAALLNAGAPAQVYSSSLGGFDTHADERGTQQRLLSELDVALGEFADAIAGVSRRVVTVVYSEFGRRVHANRSQGTDHGTAAPVFVLGDGVRSGFQGEQPSLADLDAGDLKYTVDFRDIYASILEEILGTESDRVLSGWKGRVPILA